MVLARLVSILVSTALALGTALPAAAQPAKSNAQTELMDLFSDFCLMRFPDDGATAQYASQKGFRPMPEQQLRSILGDDTGIGWLQETAFGTYEVTIRQPPSHACTIGDRLEKPRDVSDALGATLSLWVGTRHIGTLGVFPPTDQDVSGHKAELYKWVLTRTDGSKETITALVTPDDAETKIRLERTVPDQ